MGIHLCDCNCTCAHACQLLVHNQQCQRICCQQWHNCHKLRVVAGLSALTHNFADVLLFLFLPLPTAVPPPPLSGGGLVFWHPKGARVRHVIETFWKDLHLARDYELVYSPHIAKVRRRRGRMLATSMWVYTQMQV